MRHVTSNAFIFALKTFDPLITKSESYKIGTEIIILRTSDADDSFEGFLKSIKRALVFLL
jgi:hypothetical protein